jgi:Tetratricopeptide repeat.
MAIMLVCMFPFSLSAQKQIARYNPEALYNEGVLLFQNKNYGAAITAFDRYMDAVDDPKLQKAVDAQYYSAVSALYLGNGDGESKVLDFVNQNPGSTWAAHANYLYANSLFKKKKYRDALAIYEKTDASSLSVEEAQRMQFNMAYSYFQTDRIQNALPIFKVTMLNKGKYQNAAKYYYAHIQYVIGKNLDALNYFYQLRSNSTYSKIVPAYIMQINYREGNVEAILEEGDFAVKNADKKRKSEIAYIVADAWYQENEYAKALEYYEIFRSNLQGKSIPREAYYQMGVCEARTGNCEAGIKDLQKIAGEKDQLGQYASYFLAQCYAKVGEQKYARNAFYTAYVNNFDSVVSQDALFNYAKLSLLPGVDPFNEASAQLDAFISDNPYSPKKAQAEELAIYLLLNAKEYDKALGRLENMKSKSAELQDVYNQLLYSTATEAFQSGNYAKAQAYFSQILNGKEAAEQKAEACYWLGESAYALGDLNLAEKYYSQFKSMNGASQLPIKTLADYNLGYIDYQKSDYESAIVKFRTFIQNSDDRKGNLKSDAYIRLGDCYFMDRNYPLAINYYDMATRLSQKNADYALYQQGLSYSAMGQNNKKSNC